MKTFLKDLFYSINKTVAIFVNGFMCFDNTSKMQKRYIYVEKSTKNKFRKQ